MVTTLEKSIKLFIQDASGEMSKAQIFVSVLGASIATSPKLHNV